MNAITQRIIALYHAQLVQRVELAQRTLADCKTKGMCVVLYDNLKQAQRALTAYEQEHNIEAHGAFTQTAA